LLLSSGCERERGPAAEKSDAGVAASDVAAASARFTAFPLPQPAALSPAGLVAGAGFGSDPWRFPLIMSGGAGMADFDGDGRLDLIRTGLSAERTPARSTGVLQLLRQGENGEFTDVSAACGLGFSGIPGGLAIGDFSNDGLPDLCLTGDGDCRLYRNAGGFRFEDVTVGATIQGTRWSTSAAFLDFDRDGWLDLFITNYVDYDASHECRDAAGRIDYCSPSVFPGTTDRLYRNCQGDRPVAGAAADAAARPLYEDVSASSGIIARRGPGLGVVTFDFDSDGWIDILVANDGQPNFLWMNQGNGRFEEQAVLRGVAGDAAGQSQGSMGVAIGDLDDNGIADVVVTNLEAESNAVYVNDGRSFQELSGSYGMAEASWTYTGFGTVLADFDHDGRLDFAAANGRVRMAAMLGAGTENEASGDFWAAYREPQLLMLGGVGVFRPVKGTDDFSRLSAVARGLVAGDVDRDGDCDLFCTFLDREPLLFRNEMSAGNWLIVRPVLPAAGGRLAIGARVTIELSNGRRTGFVAGGGSYQSGTDTGLHFGLGAVAEIIGIEVVWPDGQLERFAGGAVNREIVLSKGN
jgi:hypothetical protein